MVDERMGKFVALFGEGVNRYSRLNDEEINYTYSSTLGETLLCILI